MTETHLTLPSESHLLLRVETAAANVDSLRAQLAQAEATRDDRICQAMAAKVPAEDIAERAGLHFKRVYQIRADGRKRAGSAPTE